MTPTDRTQRIAEHKAELLARVGIRREQTQRIRFLRRVLRVVYEEGE